MATVKEIRHFHVFCGAGGGAIGFNRGKANIGTLQGKPRCLGGIDVLPDAIHNFEQQTGAPGSVMDLFDRDQYIDFHGAEPAADWQEITPEDIRKAAGNERPHIIFTSPPCKGFSGLLSQKKSETDKYRALNRLTVRGIFLCMEAWQDDPPEFFLLENVPRIEARGGELLDQIQQLLERYGYIVARTTHDCGHVAGLAQSRKRFLLVARHAEKVPPFLYEPPHRPLNSVGKVLEGFPMPGNASAGPLHSIPQLHWKTWVRLAFVEAGKDWRSLRDLAVNTDGTLRDYLIIPEYHKGYLGVRDWHCSTGAVPGRSTVTNDAFAVADPRPNSGMAFSKYNICRLQDTAGTVIAGSNKGEGAFGIADPRPANHRRGGGKYKIVPWSEHAGSVIAASTTGEGAFSVQDPRPALHREKGDHYLTAAHYGVVDWQETAGAVTAAGKYDNGKFSVADPRPSDLPDQNEKLACVIESLDGTWHRPFTTLELAALQGYVQPGEYLEMHGGGHSIWREQIGNMVPPPAAEAIFNVIAETLLLAWSGETFVLGSTPIWVQPVAAAMSVRQKQDREWH
ncbi:DNA cytosine methyltransferase [Aliamphritea hakodatensis]|uniref:DNA cytosine methyltransferase n=1 Tax=Aliamphritea hakodatensis TaxID=2895352 RepID=UPI0022FD655A|nr:DNA cytosine methyltransferase [Aliamphritea hakodatensis]